MDNFDLNIDNYSISELEELLTLNKQYNYEDIKHRKDDMCKKIANDSMISFSMKTRLDFFLEKVSLILNSVNGGGGSGNNSQHKNNFTDLKMDMMEGTNSLIIKDPTSAHNIEVNNNVNPGKSIDSYGTKRGAINPLLTNTILKAINIDTRFRENYYSTKSTNITLTLPFRLEKVISYRIVGITMPLSYYNISQSYGNNVIQINVLDRNIDPPSQVLVSYSLILPDGCYNTTQSNSQYSSTLEQVINNMLINDVSSPNNNMLTPNFNLRYTIDRTSGRSIFAQDASIPNTIPYNFEVVMSVENSLQSGQVEEDYSKVLMMKLGWVLGFRFARYSSSNTVARLPTTFGSIVSEGICFTKFPMYGFLAIDDFNNNANDYYMSVFSNSVSVPNIVAKVNLTEFSEVAGAFQGAQGESSSTAINREKRFFGPVNIQKLKVTLYDDMGRILDLNNMDWSLELAFECVYNM
jgi:hypothetical protein